ncbi:MAG: DNA-processing protein DprA, partial [Fimbriimonadales bacterium]|nr:DNA-processing protein DprA [Fimbriimonadales bacterium]
GCLHSAAVWRHGISLVRGVLQKMTERQWLLFLSLLPDVGRQTLRHLLERQQVWRLTPDEVLRLPAETLQNEYRLPPRALRALQESLPALRQETERLEAQLTRCGVRWLSFQDAAYPRQLECMPDPPALLFLYGNYELLSEPTFALLASHTISPEGLAELEQVAQSFFGSGWVPVTSATQPAYQRLLLCALRANRPYILVLDRGLLSAFGDDLRREPLRQARIWRAEFDPSRALAISPFRPRDGWLASSGRYRDALIAYLSDAPVVIEARPDGYMVQLCREMLQRGGTLSVLAYRLDQLPGNRQIVEAGGKPIASTSWTGE